jgi:protein-L-isoaspartate(D-aspartate) O-methyltransferase
VAYTLERLALTGAERVLEIGTGSGYQTALLAWLAREVLSVELEPELSSRAQVALDELGVANARLRIGDGAEGWPEEAPFDRIVVSAAVPQVPPALLDQLAPGGRMIVPVGPRRLGQLLRQIDRGADGALVEADLLAVAFVPLRGPWRSSDRG